MALWWLLPAALGVARVQERQDPHLRWSQAPPRPWRRPGSADFPIVPHSFPHLLRQDPTAAGSSDANLPRHGAWCWCFDRRAGRMFDVAAGFGNQFPQGEDGKILGRLENVGFL